MAGVRRRNLLESRRRVPDEDEDEDSALVNAGDDSLSDGSIPSEADDNLADNSDLSEPDGNTVGPRSEAAQAAAHKKRSERRRKRDTPSRAKQSGPVQESRPAFVHNADTDAMANGIKPSEGAAEEDAVDFENSTCLGGRSAVPENIPSGPKTQPGRRVGPHEGGRGDEDQPKDRASDPAAVPNRGGFFMHDQRNDGFGRGGYGASGRGRGRGRLNGPGSQAAFISAHEDNTAARWTHDLHESVENSNSGAIGERSQTAQAQTSTRPASMSALLSKTVSIGTDAGQAAHPVARSPTSTTSRQTRADLAPTQSPSLHFPQHRTVIHIYTSGTTPQPAKRKGQRPWLRESAGQPAAESARGQQLHTERSDEQKIFVCEGWAGVADRFGEAGGEAAIQHTSRPVCRRLPADDDRSERNGHQRSAVSPAIATHIPWGTEPDPDASASAAESGVSGDDRITESKRVPGSAAAGAATLPPAGAATRRRRPLTRATHVLPQPGQWKHATVQYPGEGDQRAALPADEHAAGVRTVPGIPGDVPAGKLLTIERYSDSAAAYITLSTANPSSYKQLYRAAKAKTKLRLKATVTDATGPSPAEPAADRAAASVPSLVDAGKTTDTPTFATIDRALGKLLSEQHTSLQHGTSTSVEEMDKAMTQLMLTGSASQRQQPAPPATSSSPFGSAWHVCCNNCNKAMLDTHYHCGTCDDGDYDLCEGCVLTGISCPGTGHWLIKRNIKNGKVINSTTERLTPKVKSQPQPDMLVQKPIPGSFAPDVKAPTLVPEEPRRTCNSCVRVLPEKLLINCQDCEDYDLCVQCTKEAKHGHHPGHRFEPISADAQLSTPVMALCAPGRGEYHWATCDGCDSRIQGVRHKCLDCPDWDYCSKCFEGARRSHPEHRFVPVYTKINWALPKSTRHYGVYCDGPLCRDNKDQSYIHGTRFKCAICHDTDFCANCEAHPSNKHNKTHPMIMFKTQVKHASISTIAETENGPAMPAMGDQQPRTAASGSQAPTSPPPYAPLHPFSLPYGGTAKDATLAGLVSSIPKGDTPVWGRPGAARSNPAADSSSPASVSGSKLEANFVHDRIPDGTKFGTNEIFTQTWTLRNPGPLAWPAGVTVRTTGGDNMLNIDPSRSAGSAELSAAQESIPTGCPIMPGQEWHFTVTLRSPMCAGKHISYWRAKAPDGTPFGHKLWCEIEVSSTDSSPKRQHHDFMKKNAHERQQRMLQVLHRASVRQRSQHAVQQSEAAMAAAKASFNRPQQIPISCQASSSTEGGIPVQMANGASWSYGCGDLGRQWTPTHQQRKEQVAKAEKAFDKKVNAEKAIAETAVETASDINSSTTSSQMVFPTLEKESPASSTYLEPNEPATEIIASAPAEVRSAVVPETIATASVPASAADDELVNDFDSVEFEDDSDDEIFLTDEEYDILDASDEEVVHNGVPATK
ncbi:hypothetical protein FH972_022477 [Carpinus fangiana]|uniref:ZZ-type domain-containing protein n=1 Tax=Carpinus fangiana TaxID=176857 RepID=A0A5N6KSP7_9ROSI|nr:hypothetical protein FH972_022477 [Carpinus fangiana]